ncbi:MAG: glutamate-cysteine ligase family protein [Lachnospiraceae bacterium]|nr:glutamate-cysteine ligase family protein [Lachnospiraceae bacterium]
MEIEMPVAKTDGSATDYEAVQEAFQEMIRKYDLKPEKYDDNGVCYLAINEDNGDSFSFDCSYNNLELSLGCGEKMAETQERFENYVRAINLELEKSGHILTGMGIHPNYDKIRKDFIPGSRYRMLERFLKKCEEWRDPMYFHPYPDFGAYSSAFQVQLDVEKEELLDVLKAFSMVEPVKAVLFNNSWISSEPDKLCSRDMFWENSTHGINPHNIGAFNVDFPTIDAFLEYLTSTSMFCTERDGRYYHFHPIPVTEYYKADSITAEYYENGEFHTEELVPDLQDLTYLRTYKFEDLTFRGTIEFRSICCQPLSEMMAATAFHVGLMENVSALKVLLEEDHVLYHHGYNQKELRDIMNLRNWPDFIDREGLKALCLAVLDVAKQGLKKRGFDEEYLLEPLYGRAEKLQSPARAYVEALEAGVPKEVLIRQYSLADKRFHIQDETVKSLLFDGHFGLEKEGLRITEDGYLSLTPHPFPGHDHVVRDFSENQTEINTSVEESPEKAVESLYQYTRLIQETLKKLPEPELLWPFSNPPYIRNEKDLPVAQFYGENASKTAYREYLSDRYGRYKMSFSGIHVNYSFSEELLKADFRLSGEKDYKEYKNRIYLALAEGCAAYSWILTAVTAASPVLDKSFVEKGRFGENIHNGMASVRCSELGYWNQFTPLLDYSSIQGYTDSIQQYVKSGLIAAPSELYYPVRLKPAGAYDLEKLITDGADHIELRMFDLNPLCKEGIDIKDLKFAQLLLIWLLGSPREAFSKRDQVQAAQNFKNAAHYDLKTVKIVFPSGEVCSVSDAGRSVIDRMKAFFRGYPEEVQAILDFEERKFIDPENRYAWKLQKLLASGFVEEGLKIAKNNAGE